MKPFHEFSARDSVNSSCDPGYAAEPAFRSLSFLCFLQMLVLEVLAQVTGRAKRIDANGRVGLQGI